MSLWEGGVFTWMGNYTWLIFFVLKSPLSAGGAGDDEEEGGDSTQIFWPHFFFKDKLRNLFKFVSVNLFYHYAYNLFYHYASGFLGWLLSRGYKQVYNNTLCKNKYICANLAICVFISNKAEILCVHRKKNKLNFWVSTYFFSQNFWSNILQSNAYHL